MKYIDAEKLIAEIERLNSLVSYESKDRHDEGLHDAYKAVKNVITSLQQEQQTCEQVVVITESHGNANIEWDCRSLDDVMALLKSAESFILDKQVEELRGPGSGPDYDSTEGRYSKPRKSQQEQPEVDFEKAYKSYMESRRDDLSGNAVTVNMIDIARHFFELGLNARK